MRRAVVCTPNASPSSPASVRISRALVRRQLCSECLLHAFCAGTNAVETIDRIRAEHAADIAAIAKDTDRVKRAAEKTQGDKFDKRVRRMRASHSSSPQIQSLIDAFST